jgi:HSP20 family molecular chaperone IbpA
MNRMVKYFEPTFDFWGSQFMRPSIFENMISNFFERDYSQDSVKRTENGWQIKLIVPGVPKDKIDLKVEGQYLVLECKDENTAFRKRWSLSKDVIIENISAKLIDGVLTIDIEQKTPEVIQIKIA